MQSWLNRVGTREDNQSLARLHRPAFKLAAEQVALDRRHRPDVLAPQHLDHLSGTLAMVQQGAHPHESNGPEKLFVVQLAVVLAELRVAFGRKNPELLVERHGACNLGRAAPFACAPTHFPPAPMARAYQGSLPSLFNGH